MIWRTAVQPEADVKIELLKPRHPPGAAAVENLTGPRVIGIFADVLHKQVARRPEFMFQRQSRLEGRINCVLVRELGDGEHTVQRPIVSESSRPRGTECRGRSRDSKSCWRLWEIPNRQWQIDGSRMERAT